jgi:hypothetical protein
MCDYSLHNVRTRPAEVGDKLITHSFPTGTRGFCAPEDGNVAVCLLPGTELSFTGDVGVSRCGRGVSARSNTGLRSSVRLIKRSETPITTH